MSTNNPWILYVSVVGPLLIGYYLFVGVRFYWEDIRSKIRGWQNSSNRMPAQLKGPQQPQLQPETDFQNESLYITDLNADQQNVHQEESEPVWQNEALMQQMEELSVHLRQAVEQVHQHNEGAEQLVALLQTLLTQYPALRGTPFQLSVNTLVEAECAKYGSIHLRGEDKMQIWSQVD